MSATTAPSVITIERVQFSDAEGLQAFLQAPDAEATATYYKAYNFDFDDFYYEQTVAVREKDNVSREESADFLELAEKGEALANEVTGRPNSVSLDVIKLHAFNGEDITGQRLPSSPNYEAAVAYGKDNTAFIVKCVCK